MNSRNVKVFAGAAGAVVLLGAAAFWFTGPGRKGSAAGDGQAPKAGADGKAGTVAHVKAVRPRQPDTRPAAEVTPGEASVTSPENVVSEGLGGSTSAVETADQLAAQAMRDKLDNEDTAGALAMARGLMKSGEAEVRSEVVSVLGWVGAKALPELGAMTGDQDADVAQEAYDQWLQALQEVEDDALKAQLLADGLQRQKDQDKVDELFMQFDQMPEEIALPVVVNLINSSNPLTSEAARTVYEEMTGSPYTTPAAAQQAIEEAKKAAE